MSKYVTCQVCGKKVDFNLQNCPYCKAMLLVNEEDAVEEEDEIEVFDEHEPVVNEQSSLIDQLEEQPIATYNAEDAAFQPTSVMQAPVQQPVQQQPIVQQPMMQAPTVDMPNKPNEIQTIQALPDEEKKNPLGLLLALIIIGGAGYYFVTHKDQLMPKSQETTVTTAQEISKKVTEINNCTIGENDFFTKEQYMYLPNYDDNREIISWGVTTNKEEKNYSSKICTNVNNKPVISYDELFKDRKIEKLDLSSFNTSQITSMRSMFEGVIISELDLRGFDTTNVMSMNNMFDKATINKLDISSFTFTSTEIGAYYLVTTNAKIDSIILGNIDFPAGTNILQGIEFKKIQCTNSKTINYLKEIYGEDIEIVSKL